MTIDPERGVGQVSADNFTVPVETSVFDDKPEAQFYVGMVAVPGEVIMPVEHEAWLKLRGNVYVHEMGFMGPDALDDKGRESDVDDERSVQFAIIQNLGSSALPRVVGGARLILKRDEDDALPVEKFFPEAFVGSPAPLESSEASRVIARNDNKLVRGMVAMGAIRALALHTYDNGRKPVYVVIEDHLESMYQKTQVPYRQVAPYKFLDEYQTPNMAASIDPAAMIASVRPESHVNAPFMAAFYDGAEAHKGLGYFDATLTRSL